MNRQSIADIARGTKTYRALHDGKPQPPRAKRRGPMEPLLVADGLYLAVDVQESFGLSVTSFAQWKLDGLETYSVPAGDLVTGAGVIEFLKSHRKKRIRGRDR